MSYDIKIGNKSFNYTFNVAEMWYRAVPTHGIKVIDSMLAGEAYYKLCKIRQYMEENYEQLKMIEPDNGWGTFNGAYDFICKLTLACLDDDEALCEVYT
jgi:hypothetical protein